MTWRCTVSAFLLLFSTFFVDFTVCAKILSNILVWKIVILSALHCAQSYINSFHGVIYAVPCTFCFYAHLGGREEESEWVSEYEVLQPVIGILNRIVIRKVFERNGFGQRAGGEEHFLAFIPIGSKVKHESRTVSIRITVSIY